MATINAIISLTDRMTRPIQNIIGSVNSLISITERVAVSNNRAFDVRQFDGARRELNLAQAQMRVLEQATRNATNSQRQYNNEIRNGVNSADNLVNKVKSIAGAYIGIQGLQKLVNTSDMYVQTQARLGLMVDDGGSVSVLEDKIMAAANRARASYSATADAIAKMGLNASSAFNGNDELIAFMENINKQFVIGGASAAAQEGAMVQLTQAMAAGALRGEELNSILDAAPMIARNIEKYMNWAEGSIKSYAEQGLVSAQVVKNAMLSSTDEINNKFNSMPMTWGQVWNIFSNYALRATKPVLIAISWIANNLSWLVPLIAGVGSAFIVFQIAANWTKIAAFATGLYNGAVTLLSIGFGILTGNTAAASAAMFTFNSALLANPITWIIMLILILIGILYAGVAAYNKFTNSSVSATGIIGGAFGVMVAFIGNKIILLWNVFADFANFIGNFLNDPVAAVKILFLDMTQTVIGYIQNMIRGIEDLINKIPGVQVDITSGVDNYLEGIRNTVKQIKDESGWKEYVSKKII